MGDANCSLCMQTYGNKFGPDLIGMVHSVHSSVCLQASCAGSLHTICDVIYTRVKKILSTAMFLDFELLYSVNPCLFWINFLTIHGKEGFSNSPRDV